MDDLITLLTSAGTVTVYETKEGYWVRNTGGHRIGDLGCGAFKTVQEAERVARNSAHYAQVRYEAGQLA